MQYNLEMMWQYRVTISEDQALRLEECEDTGGWFHYRDALEETDYLVGYFESDEEALRGLTRMGEVVADLPVLDRAVREPLEDRDWKEAYKEHFKPWAFHGLHWVPVWERETYDVPEGESAIWLDPGMAFGTGNHETTRLCVERMMAFRSDLLRRDRVLAECSVLDAGSGSGILALSAARMGFGRVAGFDNDAEAVAISRENAARNGLEEQVGFYVAGLPDGLEGRRADLVLANIQSDVLCHHAGDLLNAVAPGGLLAMSGILASEVDQVRDRFLEVSPGLKPEYRTMGEWADLVVSRECQEGDGTAN